MRETRAFTLSEAVDLYRRVIRSGPDVSLDGHASLTEGEEAARFPDLASAGVGSAVAEGQLLQS
jgi:hypothetical protein